jgi:release factor glutamine methyltransferase
MKYKNAIEGMGVDISEEALEVARKNAESLGVHVDLTWSDVFQNVNDVFDAILSNPPYIRSDVIKNLSEEVKNHDPRLALDGKEDGLYFYRILAQEALDYLKLGGKLIMEIGYDQGKEVSELLRAHNYKDVTVIKDLAGLDRVVKGRK